MSLEPGIDFRIYLDEFRQDLAEIKQGVHGVGNDFDKEGKRIDSIGRKIGAGIGAYLSVQTAKAFLNNTIEVRREFEKFEAVLTNTLGSSSEAQASLNMIKEFAASTPFSVQELTDSFVKLTNQGFKPTREEMTRLGDLAASVGKSYDQLTEAIIDAQVGEFERLKEFGIRAQKEGDRVTFTFKGVKQQVDFTDESIRNYVLGLGELQGVSGSMAAISKTLDGQISNLGDSFDSMYNTLGEGRLGGAIKGSIGLLKNGVDTITRWMSIPAAEKLRDEHEEVNTLVIQLQSANIEEETRETLLARLNEIAPDVAKAITNEAKGLDDLNKALEKYNKSMALKILMAEQEAEIEKQRSGKGGVERYRQLLAEAEADLANSIFESLTWFEKKAPEFTDRVNEIVYDNTLSTIEKAEKINSIALQATTLGNSQLYQALNGYKIFQKRYAEEKMTLEQMIEEANAMVENYKKIIGVDVEIDDGGADGGGGVKPKPPPDFSKWKETLLAQKKEYQEFEAVKREIGEEEADKLYASLLEKAASYKDLLQKLMSQPLSKEQTGFVALELQSFSKNEDKQDAKEADKKIEARVKYYQDLLNITRSGWDKIQELNEKYIQDQLLLQLNGDTERLEQLEENYQREVEIIMKQEGHYEWLFRSIDSYSREQLKNHIANIKKALTYTQLSAEMQAELYKKLGEAEDALQSKLPNDLQKVASLLGDAASLAGEFDDNLAKAINTAAQLADAVSNIAAGLATDDPFKTTAGILQALTVVFKAMDGQEDFTQKITDSIDSLRREFEKLQDASERALGVEKVDLLNASYVQAGRNIEELKQRYNDLDAAIGSGIQGTAGNRFVDALAPWDTEREKQWEDYKKFYEEISNEYGEGTYRFYEEIANSELVPGEQRKVAQEILDNWDQYVKDQEDIIKQLGELFTGTTTQQIVDDIKSMFDQGKTSIDDFTDYFNKMMKKAIIESLSVKYLEAAMDDFYVSFAEAFADQNLTEEERAKLERDFRQGTEGYAAAMESMQEMFPDFFDVAGATDQSTAGAIKSITEDTAGILAGHLASIRVNVADMLVLGNRSLNVLDKIETNTSRLEMMEAHLKDIRDNLSNTRSYG